MGYPAPRPPVPGRLLGFLEQTGGRPIAVDLVEESDSPPDRFRLAAAIVVLVALAGFSVFAWMFVRAVAVAVGLRLSL